MPVEQRSGSSQVTSIIIGIVVVVLAVAATWGLLRLASGGGPANLRLGDDTFDAGQSKRLATQIEEEGPVLFSDVSGRGQRLPIWVNHFGDDPAQQWYVFTAVPPEAPEGCFLAWNAGENLFDVREPNADDPRAPGKLCNEDTFSVTGEGLDQFPWSIDDDDNLVIDLRGDESDDQTDQTQTDQTDRTDRTDDEGS